MANYKPSFVEPSYLSREQLTDPDYALKEIEKLNNGISAACSKCHHCR